VLAIASRGDVFVLALLLGLASRRWTAGLGLTAALAAATLRWGTPSLGGIAGAQAVLGPAGWTGSGLSVASAWLGATALVLAVPASTPWAIRWGAAAAFGAAAALVVAGPAPGGAIGVRVLATVVLVIAAYAASVASNRVTHAVALALGGAALACAGLAA
jgi:hypothetical protein